MTARRMPESPMTTPGHLPPTFKMPRYSCKEVSTAWKKNEADYREVLPSQDRRSDRATEN
jgi:hypothetical protein